MHTDNRKKKMKTIFKKYDKHAIQALPRATFEGEIKVIDKPEDVNAAVDVLLAQEVLGVDVLLLRCSKMSLSRHFTLFSSQQ